MYIYINREYYPEHSFKESLTGPIAQSKGMCAISQKKSKKRKKGKKMLKKGKVFKILVKNVQNLKIF